MSRPMTKKQCSRAFELFRRAERVSNGGGDAGPGLDLKYRPGACDPIQGAYQLAIGEWLVCYRALERDGNSTEPRVILMAYAEGLGAVKVGEYDESGLLRMR